MKKFYLCDGDVEYCDKRGCYIKGGECNFTSDISHAMDPQAYVFDPETGNWVAVERDA